MTALQAKAIGKTIYYVEINNGIDFTYNGENEPKTITQIVSRIDNYFSEEETAKLIVLIDSPAEFISMLCNDTNIDLSVVS